jgi:hypothetical protein
MDSKDEELIRLIGEWLIELMSVYKPGNLSTQSNFISLINDFQLNAKKY